jgi:hypothetical protein
MRATECVLPNSIWLTPHCSAKHDAVLFYCLLVQIMYIIHNKATFMVTENINPNIRNSKKLTIQPPPCFRLYRSLKSGSTHLLILIFVLFTILYFLSKYKRTQQKNKKRQLCKKHNHLNLHFLQNIH